MSADIRARLDAMQARADAATEGPWLDGMGAHGDPAGGPDFCEVFVSPESRIAALDLSREGAADATFIAHSRADLPALLAFARDVLDLHRPERPTGNLVTDATPSYCGGCYEAGGYDGAPLWEDCPVAALATRHLGGGSDD